ncbi:MAG: CpaF family protein [Lentisphaerae bacterium]|nr:CpaF family protein [Lentisphaerota bacterium]
MSQDLREELRQSVLASLGRADRITPEAIQSAAADLFARVEKQQRIRIDPETRTDVVRALTDEVLGLGPIQRFMDDPEVTEIMINGPDQIYVEKRGEKSRVAARFRDDAHLRRAVERMLVHTGRRVDESLPYVDFAMPNGARVNVILPPVSAGGATVTIRKFLQSLRGIEDLVALQTLDARMADFLVACIRAKLNILFSGATGSGKTTTLEVLSSYLDAQERIITIEDAPELSLRQEHVVRLLTRAPNVEGQGEVSIRDLFRNSLRMRPSRLILGEVRGEEAMDYLQAQTSGHRGCLAVLHAATPRDALTRLETMALYAGLNLPSWAVRQQVASGLELIVQHEQFLDGTRKITHLTEVAGLQGGEIALRDIFSFAVDEVTESQEVRGRFVAHGPPGFLPLFRQRGVALDEGIFAEG